MFKSQNKESDTSNEHVVNEILFNTEDGLEAIDKKVFVCSTFREKLMCSIFSQNVMILLLHAHRTPKTEYML